MSDTVIELVDCGGTLYMVTEHEGQECWLEFQKSPLAAKKNHIGTVYSSIVKSENTVKKPVRRARRKTGK